MESLSLTNLAVLNKFQREGITIADAKKIAKKIDLDVLDKIISYAKVMYFDTQSPVLEDSIYDVLIDVLSKRDPKNKNLTEVGISNSSQETVKLPYFLGSMDKVKPDTDAIEKWNAKQIKKHGEQSFNYYHLMGSGITLWLCWQIATIIGIFLGSIVPEELGLKFAIPLTFIAIIINELRKFDHLAVMIVSGLTATFFYNAPFKSYILISPLIGLFAAFLILKLKK